MSRNKPVKIARRTVIKFIAAAAAAPALWPGLAVQARKVAIEKGRENHKGPAGTPSDPDLINPVVPWELTLSDEHLGMLETLCDMIIPADEHSPSAGSIGAHDFIDEWVSAPYDGMKRDRVTVTEGLSWLEKESDKRFSATFADLEEEQKTSICDDICHVASSAPEHVRGAQFFDRVRDLTAMAFYTTPEGMKDLGYIGNVPLTKWLPPPREVLQHAGLIPDDE